MSIQQQIKDYIANQPASKRDDMQELHQIIRGVLPKSRLWFVDGKNSDGKVVSNPSIGYGFQNLRQASGKTREVYQIGLSANTAGVSIYIIGLEDKKYLRKTFGAKLGKARVTGYCIKFRALPDIDIATLKEAIRFGFGATSKASGD